MMDDRVELLLLNERVQTVIRTVLAHSTIKIILCLVLLHRLGRILPYLTALSAERQHIEAEWEFSTLSELVRHST
jgi:hypothetical protein